MSKPKEQTIILVRDGCGTCDEVKGILSKSNKSKVKLLDVDSPKGKELADKLGVTLIPECVHQSGKEFKLCRDKEFKDVLDL